MKPRPRTHSGFSLVEVVLSIGVAIVFLVGVFTLLSVGLNTSKQASDDTTVSLILQDVSNRVRGNNFAVTASGTYIGPFYYDNKGRYIDQNTGGTSQNIYGAIVTIGALDSSIAPANSNLLSAVIKLYSPVAPTANAPVPNGTSPKVTFSYYVTRSTGNGWQVVDPTYVPKIEM